MAPRRPPGVHRSRWSKAARLRDARGQRAAWSSKRRGRNARVTVPRSKLGFPTSMSTTVRYTQRLDVAPTSLDTLTFTFAANDIFDPDVTGGGHQPRGSQEYAVIYDTFTVTSSRVLVNWMFEGYGGPSTVSSTGALQSRSEDSTTSPAVSPVICGIFKSNKGYGGSIKVADQMEQDRTTWTVMNTQSSTKSTSASSDFSEFFGKQDLIAADGYSGTTGGSLVGSSPSEKVFYHIWAARGSDDYPDGVCKTTAYVTIEYKVTYTSPKKLDAS